MQFKPLLLSFSLKTVSFSQKNRVKFLKIGGGGGAHPPCAPPPRSVYGNMGHFRS